jgi:hypothetical protein
MKMCKVNFKDIESSKGRNTRLKGDVNQVEEDKNPPMAEEKSLGKIDLNNIGSGNEGYKVRLLINNQPLCMELDTGSALTICLAKFLRKIFLMSDLVL